MCLSLSFRRRKTSLPSSSSSSSSSSPCSLPLSHAYPLPPPPSPSPSPHLLQPLPRLPSISSPLPAVAHFPSSSAAASSSSSSNFSLPHSSVSSSSSTAFSSPSLLRSSSSSSSASPGDLRAFSYAELQAATRSFSPVNLLGEGGFGCVYRGTLHLSSSSSSSPLQVAVKRLNIHGHQGIKEWLAEVRFLGMVEHPNVVKLVGYCAEEEAEDRLLLVYEYMANMSLEHHLFSRTPTASSSASSVLDWSTRLHILLGAARGLAYLHEEIPDVQVIFRDFKTSNVLLDEDFNPKLSDFGLARQGPEMGASHVSTSVVGTMGYAAPEYLQTGHLTVKSDIWSYGVVLLEMISGRRSLDPSRPRSEHVLLEWARPYLYGSKKIHYIIDPQLQGTYSLSQAQRLVKLALECLNTYPRGRPRMSTVVQRLKEIIDIPDESDGSAQLDVVQPRTDTKKPIRLKRRGLCFGNLVRFPGRVLLA